MAKASIINIIASGSAAGVPTNLVDAVYTNAKQETKTKSFVEFPSIKDSKGTALSIATKDVLTALSLIEKADTDKAKKNAITSSPMSSALVAAEETEGESFTETLIRASQELSAFLFEHADEDESRDTETSTVKALAKMLLANTPANESVPSQLTISVDLWEKAAKMARKLDNERGRTEEGYCKLSSRTKSVEPVRVDKTNS